MPVREEMTNTVLPMYSFPTSLLIPFGPATFDGDAADLLLL